MRLYLDTSVFGGYFDEEFAASTQKFFNEVFKGKHEVIFSSAVVEELLKAPEKVRKLILQIPEKNLIRVNINQEIIKLAESYIKHEVISSKFDVDALHIAFATISKVDVLLSWNFKHIVNLQKIRGFNAINLLNGYNSIEIRTPKEIINET